MLRSPRRPAETDEQFQKREDEYWQKVMEAQARVQRRRDLVHSWRGQFGTMVDSAEKKRI